ncbi:DUF3520 domain-containing protein [Marinilabiliaceae bacterium JC017]|nr:DUF3520 domain-containing protein [Marinilabiliaceae bacterium JC017]
MKRFIQLLALILVASGLQAQTLIYKVTGTVTDDSGQALPGVSVLVKGSTNGVISDVNGYYAINVNERDSILLFRFIGFEPQEIAIRKQKVINVVMRAELVEMEEVVVSDYGIPKRKLFKKAGVKGVPSMAYNAQLGYCPQRPDFNTEGYSTIQEIGYKEVMKQPLSTFSVDVDRASYANIRRFLNNGKMPPKDAVRIEEMINYFDYDYEAPTGDDPFTLSSEIAVCPWNEAHYLYKVGLKGKEIEKDHLPASNLVFLLDVSGSMNAPNKLPLLKSAFRLLVDELREEDYVSIVVYAGAAGRVLEPTSGKEMHKILTALDQLQAGGSTAGGAGLQLAYKTARENFIEGGNNRIILATDGDFNVGVSSNAAMERLVETERDNGVFVTVLGFGMGNYKDDKMEIIADKGNGNYAYIDNLQEARKTLVSEFGGTLFTIAKDVKLQIEFNPNKIMAYRLIGYENRMLNAEDFNDDKKDAGEVGAGHTVTALYELIPVGAEDASEWVKEIDPLKYQKNKKVDKSAYANEWLTLKLRYKEPDANTSQLISVPVKRKVQNFNAASDNFRFAASVAGYGMLLRDSEFKGDLTFKQVARMAENSRGKDEEGFKAEMIRLVKTAEVLNKDIVEEN